MSIIGVVMLVKGKSSGIAILLSYASRVILSPL
jgi:hypothetical protein